MGYLQDLRTELDAGHPDTGTYNANDQTAADEINAFNRPANGGVSGMLAYMLENRSRTNTGTDTVATSIVGRLHDVANGTAGTDPFGHGVSGSNLTMEHIHSARMLWTLITSPHLEDSGVDFSNTEVQAMVDTLSGGAGNARVYKPADADAIKGLSDNLQSRAMELGFGRVKAIDVTDARALP